MVNIYVFCDVARKKKDGGIPVMIAVKTSEGRFMVNSGLVTMEKFTGRSFPKSEKNGKVKTSVLGKYLLETEAICLANENADNAQLKLLIRQKVLGKNVPTPQKTLVDYINDYAALASKGSTAELYKATAKKVDAFDSGATFDSIDRAWLERFEKELTKTMTVNGAAIQLRNLRAVFNRAIDDEKTQNYPFRKFKIKQETTRKRSLNVEQIRLLRDYPCEKWQEEYRDLWLLQFYLIGINISDLLGLKKLTDGRCVYHRNKTGRLYDIAVQPEALAIIEKYKGKKYLLRPLDRYKSVADYTHHMNDALKKIGPYEVVADKLGKRRKIEYQPLFPALSAYWNRHSWATIAAEIDIPKEIIGKALGHSEWDNTTTDIYINFDMRKVDEANRKVIDYVNGI